MASIRKIISEDDPEAQAPEGGAAPASEDVLELTDKVPEGSEAAREREVDDILSSAMDGAGSAPRGAGGSLVSQSTDSRVTSTLAGFADALAQGDTTMPGGGQTLDDIVRAAIEPYLKTWLDENLEPLVERMVSEELKRMARRAEDL